MYLRGHVCICDKIQQPYKVMYLYYSKFAKDQLFDIAYCSHFANDTPVRGPHYYVLKLLICHVQLALIIFYSFKSIFIFITNTQKKHCRKSAPQQVYQEKTQAHMHVFTMKLRHVVHVRSVTRTGGESVARTQLERRESS